MKRFVITPGFILLVSFLLFSDKMFMEFVIALTIHELAHTAAALLLGGRAVSCRLSLTGGHISVDGLSYGREMVAVAAGPAASLAAAFIAAHFDLFLFAGINFSLGVYNLLPARCLDGGRLIELIITRNGGNAEKPLKTLTALSTLALLVPLIIAFCKGVYNWSLIIFVIFLLFSK
jgi:membrane-associated protease RseP (regulator of RpoE activity)